MPQGNLATHNYEASSPFLATPSGTATGAISTESEHYTIIITLGKTYLKLN